jgi:hypothetical protein
MNSQPDYEAELKESLREGLAVIVAGTGISIAASFDASRKQSHPQASWTGLLEDGLNWLKEKRLIDAQYFDARLNLLKDNPKTHHFISVAEDVVRKMGGAQSEHFADWLKRTVGSIEVRNSSILDALEAIRLRGNLLTTTNYDGLLISCNKHTTPVTWMETDDLIGAVRKRDNEKIIFLHGYCRQPESVVFDWKSYERISRDINYRDELAAFWKTSIWVYVGCGVNGLEDPDIGLLLQTYGRRARQARHWDFCLVRVAQKNDFQAHFNAQKLNIRAVSFGDNHSDLPEYLRSLMPPSIPLPGAEGLEIRGQIPVIEGTHPDLAKAEAAVAQLRQLTRAGQTKLQEIEDALTRLLVWGQNNKFDGLKQLIEKGDLRLKLESVINLLHEYGEIGGSNTKVEESFSWLSIPRKEWLGSTTALLRADHAIVPFQGRESELGDFANWCREEAKSRVRVLTGPGGMGKTRFARELCLQLMAAGIQSGFVDLEESEQCISYLKNSTNKPMLLVVDYAEVEEAKIGALIRAAAKRSLSALRVLLLARGAGFWWNRLRRSGDAVEKCLAVSPDKIRPLALNLNARRESFESARNAFAEKLGTKGSHSEPPDLTAQYYDRTLLLHMSALLSIQNLQAQGMDPILQAVLNRDIAYWSRQIERRSLPQLLEPGFERAMGVISAYDGVGDKKEALKVLSKIRFFSDQPQAILESIADILHDSYGGSKWIEPILPDLFKEFLIAKATKDDSSDFDNILLPKQP